MAKFLDRCRFFNLSLIIAAVVFLAYLPSLWHVFRADQLSYMSYMGQRPASFQSLIVKGYDYPRDENGDVQLFRPLFYILMDLEYGVFGTDPLGWQLTGIILHILLTVIIFRFLWLVFDRTLAFICALYFGVLPTIMEMVVWQHIHLYMLFLIFFYLACIGILEFKKRHDVKFVILITAALTGAVFTYEVACALTCVIAGYIFWITPHNNLRRFLNSGIVLLPIVIYLAWDFYSLNVHHLNRESLIIPGAFSFISIFKNFFFVHLTWIEWIALPSQFGITINDRFMSSIFNGFNPATIFWIVLFYYCARSISINVIHKGFELRSVFFISISIYALIITIGRIIPRGEGELQKGVYYAYVYMAFCLPLFAGFIDIRKLKNLVVDGWQRRLLVFAIIGSIGYCFIYTLDKNIEGSRKFAPQRELLTFVNRFIEHHKNEPKFSFTVAYDAKGNYFIPWFINSKENTNYTFAQSVYARYYKSNNWRYRIFFDSAENIYRVQRQNWMF